MNNNKKEHFIKCSIKEREHVAKFAENNPEFQVISFTCPSGYSTFDCFAISGKSKMAIEIKTRNKNIDDYPNGIIKVSKYQRIMQKMLSVKYATTNGLKPYYMTFYNDAVAIWNLFDVDKNYTAIKYGKYNYEGSDEVKNELFLLPLSQATIIKY